MSGWKRWPARAYLYTKRLYKKPFFVGLLLALVVFTGVTGAAMRQESSMVRIGLVEQGDSPWVTSFVQKLTQSEGVVAYQRVSFQQAEDWLEQGQLDGILIFPTDLEQALEEYCAKLSTQPPLRMFLREKTVTTQLWMERVYGELFPKVAEALNKQYGNKTFQDFQWEGFQEQLAGVKPKGSIVEFAYVNSNGSAEDTNYLLTPLRGMVATMVLLGTMACGVYYLSYREAGGMEAIPQTQRWAHQVLYAGTGGVQLGLFGVLALWASGLLESLGRELLAMGIYGIAGIGFTLLLSRLAGSATRMATLLPLLCLGILAVCPIFIHWEIPVLPYLFPTYWYLAMVHQGEIMGLAVYCAGVWSLAFLVGLLCRGWKKE